MRLASVYTEYIPRKEQADFKHRRLWGVSCHTVLGKNLEEYPKVRDFDLHLYLYTLYKNAELGEIDTGTSSTLSLLFDLINIFLFNYFLHFQNVLFKFNF